MLCSECKKNTAVVFINKIENGVSTMEGLCKSCAQKKGLEIPDVQAQQNPNIPPHMSNIDMANMSKQYEIIVLLQ